MRAEMRAENKLDRKFLLNIIINKKMKKRRRQMNRCGGRWTVPRQAILDVFINNPSKHMSADDVFMKVKEKNSGVGLATVYRNLEFLSEEGFISRIQLPGGKAFYELNDEEKDHHHHLICTSCGKVTDYSEFIQRELRLMKDLEKELSQKHNFSIENHELTFFGVCGECRG